MYVCINIYTCNLLVHALLVNHSLYTHVHTHTHTHTHTHPHSLTHTHTLTHSLTHTLTHTPSLTHSHTHPHSLTLPHHSSPHTLGTYTCCMYTHLCQLQLSCIVCVYVCHCTMQVTKKLIQFCTSNNRSLSVLFVCPPEDMSYPLQCVSHIQFS